MAVNRALQELEILVTHLEQYQALLCQYHEVISQPSWWDGRREVLVKDMDKVWAKLNDKQRDYLIRDYTKQLYEQRLGAGHVPGHYSESTG